MRKKLTEQGWNLIYECVTPCGVEHFTINTKPGYVIVTRPKKGIFSILLNNQVVAGPAWEYQLDEKLKANGLH